MWYYTMSRGNYYYTKGWIGSSKRSGSIDIIPVIFMLLGAYLLSQTNSLGWFFVVIGILIILFEKR